MGTLPYNSSLSVTGLYINENMPADIRTVVSNVEDLTNGTIPNVYQGLVVNVTGTGDLYVFIGTSIRAAKLPENWIKVGGDPADNLDYYEQKLGARVVDSFDELTSPSLESPYAGMFGVVKVSAESESESEDESGLYVLTREPNTTASNWYRILGGSGSGNADSGLDVTEVITSDGSAPASGTGFSINSNDPDAIVEEVYADDYLHADVYYTSKGINSSKDNGGSELEGVSSITLSNGGSSWIKLNNRGTIRINIEDDTLGFNLENIVGLIDDGTEYQNPYAGNPYSPSPIILSLADGCFLKFDKDIDFTGFTETRDDDHTEYVFGSTGSTFSDLDFYTTDILPTVYAYADGEAVRVLTEGDKDELINMIEEATDFTPITDTQIRNLF